MIAYYLKYRPQSLDEVVGQEAVKKILLGAFGEKRLSHAYLFVGPRGTGKTSTARILAKMVNCEKSTVYPLRRSFSEASSLQSTAEVGSRKSEDIPCNKCSVCISITDGSNLDLIEIDAASNRGIEDIRSLREKIKLSPSQARKKVYIIDEVHMLTPEAFNALLKTLEEPPVHALFILATTDVNKLPQTILSRVQRLDFKPATPAELLEALQKIVKLEKIDIDEEGLKILVKKADGSFRDGVKFLDQISPIGGKITAKVINDSLKSSNFEDLLQIMQKLSVKDTKECLLTISTLASGGDIKELMLSLMDSFRSLLFIKNSLGEQLVRSHIMDEKYQQLVGLADSFSNKDLIRCLNILQYNLEKLKSVSIPSLPLELAVVEICGGEITETQTLDDRNLKLGNEVGSSKLEDLTSNLQPQSPVSNFQHPPSNSDSPDIFKIKEKWSYVCETIRSFNFSLEALLRSINIRECSETTIIMEVPYSFHQRILEAPKNRDILESILSEILGRSIKVATVLGVRPARKEDIANIELAQDDEIIRVAAEIFNSDSIN